MLYKLKIGYHRSDRLECRLRAGVRADLASNLTFLGRAHQQSEHVTINNSGFTLSLRCLTRLFNHNSGTDPLSLREACFGLLLCWARVRERWRTERAPAGHTDCLHVHKNPGYWVKPGYWCNQPHVNWESCVYVQRQVSDKILFWRRSLFTLTLNDKSCCFLSVKKNFWKLFRWFQLQSDCSVICCWISPSIVTLLAFVLYVTFRNTWPINLCFLETPQKSSWGNQIC